MSFDFTKIRAMNRREHKYRCKECGEEMWYTIELPPHLKKHIPLGYTKCGGRLEHIGTRPYTLGL